MYWYIPLIAVAGFVAYVLLLRWRPGSKVTPLDTTKRELEAIAAANEVANVRAELGHAEAVKHVEEKYRERLAQLTEAQAARAKKLEDDPEALARFIVRGTEP